LKKLKALTLLQAEQKIKNDTRKLKQYFWFIGRIGFLKTKCI